MLNLILLALTSHTLIPWSRTKPLSHMPTYPYNIAFGEFELNCSIKKKGFQVAKLWRPMSKLFKCFTVFPKAEQIKFYNFIKFSALISKTAPIYSAIKVRLIVENYCPGTGPIQFKRRLNSYLEGLSWQIFHKWWQWVEDNLQWLSRKSAK